MAVVVDRQPVGEVRHPAGALFIHLHERSGRHQRVREPDLAVAERRFAVDAVFGFVRLDLRDLAQRARRAELAVAVHEVDVDLIARVLEPVPVIRVAHPRLHEQLARLFHRREAPEFRRLAFAEIRVDETRDTCASDSLRCGSSPRSCPLRRAARRSCRSRRTSSRDRSSGCNRLRPSRSTSACCGARSSNRPDAACRVSPR